VGDVNVEDGNEYARDDGKRDGQRAEDLEVVARDSLQPVHGNRDDSVDDE